MNVTWLIIAFGSVLANYCYAASEQGTVAGTYELLACKGACSFAKPETAFAKGMVVLFNDVMSKKEVERVDPFHSGPPDEKIRACFTGDNLKGGESFIFTQRTGVSSWSLKGKKLEFSLLFAIDAGYDVEASREGDVFSGKGVSWSAPEPPGQGYGPDSIVGRRKGPPNISACASAQLQPAT